MNTRRRHKGPRVAWEDHAVVVADIPTYLLAPNCHVDSFSLSLPALQAAHSHTVLCYGPSLHHTRGCRYSNLHHVSNPSTCSVCSGLQITSRFSSCFSICGANPKCTHHEFLCPVLCMYIESSCLHARSNYLLSALYTAAFSSRSLFRYSQPCDIWFEQAHVLGGGKAIELIPFRAGAVCSAIGVPDQINLSIKLKRIPPPLRFYMSTDYLAHTVPLLHYMITCTLYFQSTKVTRLHIL